MLPLWDLGGGVGLHAPVCHPTPLSALISALKPTVLQLILFAALPYRLVTQYIRGSYSELCAYSNA